jgi:hypothetical protein
MPRAGGKRQSNRLPAAVSGANQLGHEFGFRVPKNDYVPFVQHLEKTFFGKRPD